MPRIRITISSEANNALLELQRKIGSNPSEIITGLLTRQHSSLIDDELCPKQIYSYCILYQIQMPFSFPYECESFDFVIENRDLRLYLERVPKRKIIGRLPFVTKATIIIKLDNCKDFPSDLSSNEIQKEIQNTTDSMAFSLLKSAIIQYRRITGDYYNIGIIEPPMTLERFYRGINCTIYRNKEVFSTWRIMHFKEESFISVNRKLDENVQSRLLDSVNQSLKDKEFSLSVPEDFFDQSIVSYYHEEWNLCLIQGVIAMESALSRLVHNSAATKAYIKKKGSKVALNKSYKNATGLPEKIKKFLFPILLERGLTNSEEMLKKLMPLIINKKTNDGLYELRSKAVNEGYSVTEEESKRTIEIVPQFFEIVKNIVFSFQ